MKKRIITNVLAVSVVVAMAMSVAACGNQTEETAAETAVETSAEETVEETEETVVAETETVESEVVETEAAVEIEYSIDEAILGTWSFEDNGIVTVYTFNDDNTAVVEFSGEGFDEPTAIDCTFSADGQTLALYVDGIESDRAVYVIDGDTLTIGEGEEAIVLAR